jgi:hypothetical protein
MIHKIIGVVALKKNHLTKHTTLSTTHCGKQTNKQINILKAFMQMTKNN